MSSAVIGMVQRSSSWSRILRYRALARRKAWRERGWPNSAKPFVGKSWSRRQSHKLLQIVKQESRESYPEVDDQFLQFGVACYEGATKNRRDKKQYLGKPPMNRRELLKAAAALPLAQTGFAKTAFAQGGYPTRNITMIVPFPAGGQADLAARPVALALERIIGKPVIVDNRAGGAGGSIGNAQAARADADGYTLLMTLSSLAVLPEADRLFDRPVAYEVSQFAPIARVLADPTLLAVPASAPWKTLQEFVDDAKARPGQIPYGSSGPYGTLHVAMEMFAASAGIKLLHVPFRGAGPALTALLSGTVQALASAPGTLKQQVEDGKMRVLANWGAERIASFPDLPTFRELGYSDVEFYIWAGLFAPSALPAPIMTRLREAMAQAVKAPEVTKTFEVAGSPVAYLDAPEFSKFMAGDSARLIAAVKKIGKVE
jgi:tripartite-type tricarboxylate transporter receptor subunit TctC